MNTNEWNYLLNFLRARLPFGLHFWLKEQEDVIISFIPLYGFLRPWVSMNKDVQVLCTSTHLLPSKWVGKWVNGSWIGLVKEEWIYNKFLLLEQRGARAGIIPWTEVVQESHRHVLIFLTSRLYYISASFSRPLLHIEQSSVSCGIWYCMSHIFEVTGSLSEHPKFKVTDWLSN